MSKNKLSSLKIQTCSNSFMYEALRLNTSCSWELIYGEEAAQETGSCLFCVEEPNKNKSRLPGSLSRLKLHVCRRPPSGGGLLSIEVHLLEEGLPKLVAADHNSTGRGYFDHPGHKTCKNKNMLSCFSNQKAFLHIKMILSTCKKALIPQISPDLLQNVPSGRGSLCVN